MSAAFVDEIHQLSATEYLLLLAFLLLAMGSLLIVAFVAFRHFRFIDGTATSRIRSAAQGLVELKGLAEFIPGDQQKSPFSERRCVWYHCTIEKRKRSGKHAHWINISDEQSDSLFHLEDETGRCIIDPDQAHIIPEIDRSWYGSGIHCRNKVPQRSRRIRRGGKYRFRERLISPATELYALGEFRSFHSNPSEESVNKRVEEKIRTWKLQPQRYLAEFDLDKNNKIENEEWQLIRVKAQREVLAEISDEQQIQHVLSRPSNRREPYILSAVEEKSMVSSTRLKAYSSLVGVLVIFSVFVWCLSIRTPVW